METTLTKAIKERLRYFKPQLKTDMRTIRWAEEVSTPTGYVDVIRFEDYVKQDESFCSLIDPATEGDRIMHGNRPRACKIEGQTFPNNNCRGCVHKRNRHILDILTTCYEVKITASDFKSKNGHNFHGNRNYYAVPNEIFDKIISLVPDGIGVIVYYQKGKMIVKKECKHLEIDPTDLNCLLYYALKKWADGTQETSHNKAV